MRNHRLHKFIVCALGLAAITASLFVCMPQAAAAGELRVISTETGQNSSSVTANRSTTLPAATEKEISTAIQDIYSYLLSAMDVENGSALVSALAEDAGSSANDWLFLTLCECRRLDFTEAFDASVYGEALCEQLQTETTLTGTDRERIALCLSAIGEEKEWIQKVIGADSYSKGIMSEIYGLMLLNSGAYEADVTKEELAEAILAGQLENGGLGLTGTSADVDVTAMAIRALAPLKDNYTEALDRAVGYLQDQQLEGGGYASMGDYNAESTAQVILALTELGIDPLNAEGFTNPDDNPVTALLSFRLEDGSFAHLEGGSSNMLATVQSCDALLALADYYGITGQMAEENTAGSDASGIAEENRTTSLTGFQTKMIWLAILVGILFLTLTYLILSGRRSLPVYLGTLAIGIALALFILLSQIESPEEYKERKLVDAGDMTVSLEIIGRDSVILETTELTLPEGASVFEELEQAALEEDIPIGYTGSALFSNIYVQSIDGLAEREYGDSSGWTYTVNGIMPQVGAAAYELQDGDAVQWIYVGEE